MIYFKDSEFLCHCGCGGGIEKMDKDFLNKLEDTRDYAGIPFFLVSAYRCPKHNKDVGSTSDNHPLGRAVDVRCRTSQARYRIISGALKAGFTRIGIHKTFIHMDNNSNQAPEVIWVY